MSKLIQSTTLAALLIAGAAHAQVTIEAPWVRATVPQQGGSAAFMRLTAKSDTKLVQARSAVAKTVEIHEMALENDVMKMRHVPALALPAGQTVALEPGGYHIMLLGLHGQIQQGDQVPLTLTFEDGTGKRHSVEVQAPARAVTSTGAGHGHHKGEDKHQGGHQAHGH